MTTIHRASLNGRTVCGTPGNISHSGVLVTCSACIRLTTPPTRAEALAQLATAAAQCRASRCPKCGGSGEVTIPTPTDRGPLYDREPCDCSAGRELDRFLRQQFASHIYPEGSK